LASGIQDYEQYTKLPYLQNPYAYRRRSTREVKVGDVGVGGNNPIRVQSMTTTDTLDTAGTVEQAIRLVNVGCEIVRITTPTAKDAENLRNIRDELEKRGYRNVPLVADIHFNPNAAMEAAKWADKVRINPGNFADAKKFAVINYTPDEYKRELDRIEQKFRPLVRRCKELGRSIRIGTNHGSLSDRIMNYYGDTPEGMVESALEFAVIAHDEGFDNLIFSMKASNPKVMIQAYRLLAARLDALDMAYPFHLGVTEAGNAEDGRIKSAIGIASLLEDGIGDTIRVSLTEDPEYEIPVAARIARRYTPLDEQLLQKAGISDKLGVPVALEWDVTPSSLPILPDARTPYHFNKRETVSLSLGEIHVGSEYLPQVSADAAKFPELFKRGAGRTLSMAGGTATPKSSNAAPGKPDIYEVAAQELPALTQTVPAFVSVTPDSLDLALEHGAPAFAVETADADFVARLIEVANGKPVLVTVSSPYGSAAEEIQEAAKNRFPQVENAVVIAKMCNSSGAQNVILAVKAHSPSLTLRANRLLATLLDNAGLRYPIALITPDLDPSAPTDEHYINAAIAAGAVLTDGIGNMLKVGAGLSGEHSVQLAFNILQAAGARSTKAEFIACPSCGRTLFDLQETTERIKSQTGHLVGVKIAIMGCIVNGLGELADADFGYMGGAPGKVNLFVGKECVEKGVPTADADNRLIALIKQHGRWIDPPQPE
jgi:(E)-4-hydroxy-3-methylbut-2-enyl-diphosphate synthase